MNRYFYSVEEHGKKKCIHFRGHIFSNNATGTDMTHSNHEWVGVYLEVKKVKQLLASNNLYGRLDDLVSYKTDETEAYANNRSRIYFAGHPGKKRNLTDITEDTPCGDYWFDMDEESDFDFYSDEHVNKLLSYIEENYAMGGCSTTLARNILNYVAGQAEDPETALLMFDMLLDGIGITREEIIKALS